LIKQFVISGFSIPNLPREQPSMAKVLVIIGTLLAIAGAIFSYINWQTVQDTRAEIEEAQAETIDVTQQRDQLTAERDELQTQLTQAQEQLTTLEAGVKTAEENLQTAEAKLAEATQASQEKETSLTTLQQEFDDYKAKYSPEQIDTLSQQVKDLNAELADVKQARTVAEERVAELEQAVVSAEQTLESAPAGQAQGGQQPTGTAQADQGQGETPVAASGPPAAQGITGRVQAVNAGWNFVVLNVGEADGITPNTKMDVYRNGFKVGMVEVSTVEPQVSTANVVNNRQGIQPGDQVITVSPSA
jgi:septal ring factor EnvC (AmiA/AmiB activator)